MNEENIINNAGVVKNELRSREATSGVVKGDDKPSKFTRIVARGKNAVSDLHMVVDQLYLRFEPYLDELKDGPGPIEAKEIATPTKTPKGLVELEDNVNGVYEANVRISQLLRRLQI